VHLFDPHAPHDALAEYRAGRTARCRGRLCRRDGRAAALQLDAAHALDRTLVVLTADHGESLGEHGETTHGLFALNATLSVPLVVKGLPSRRRRSKHRCCTPTSRQRFSI
jgi:hypothetical protein